MLKIHVLTADMIPIDATKMVMKYRDMYISLRESWSSFLVWPTQMPRVTSLVTAGCLHQTCTLVLSWAPASQYRNTVYHKGLYPFLWQLAIDRTCACVFCMEVCHKTWVATLCKFSLYIALNIPHIHRSFHYRSHPKRPRSGSNQFIIGGGEGGTGRPNNLFMRQFYRNSVCNMTAVTTYMVFSEKVFV